MPAKPTLPKPKHKLGYTSKEVGAICKKLGVDRTTYSKAFGVNTCGVENGIIYYYPIDVERALANCLRYRKVSIHEFD